MKKIGISCQGLVRQYGCEKAFAICKESGFDAVDYGLTGFSMNSAVYAGSEDAFFSYFDNIRRLAEKYELTISQTHGRTGTYMPENEEHNETVRLLTERDLRATAILGAPCCVIHFPNSHRWGKQPPEVMHRVSGEMYDTFLPWAEKYKVKIAMETFGAARIDGDRIRDFFADPAEFLHQYNRFDTEYKTMCVDTGHTHEAESFWVPPPQDMIRILGSDISVLHLHDNNGHYDDHLLPGMGNIEWPAVFEALSDIGYTGVYNFELALKFGNLMEEFVRFAGKYLRAFVDAEGNLKG